MQKCADLVALKRNCTVSIYLQAPDMTDRQPVRGKADKRAEAAAQSLCPSTLPALLPAFPEICVVLSTTEITNIGPEIRVVPLKYRLCVE